MRKNLFLTGPIGCGKSTAIRTFLGGDLPRLGGFLTQRRFNEAGDLKGFALTSPDGSREEMFLDLSSGKPQLRMEIFDTLGVELLEGDVMILDEIGGVELLCPIFSEALEALLQSPVPIIGVLKGEGPAGKLIDRLGLSDVYARKASGLRHMLRDDPNTLVYDCGEFDKTAPDLVRQWKEEYARV